MRHLEARSATNDLSHLDGEGQYARFTYGWRQRRFDLSLSLIYSRDKYKDDEDNVLSNTAYGQTLSLHIFPIDHVVLSSSINYQDKRYIENPVTSFKRRDRNTSVSLGINYNFTPKFAAYITSNITFIDTNINSSITSDGEAVADDLFDFQEAITIGFTWDVF